MISRFIPKVRSKVARPTAPLNQKLEKKLFAYVAAGAGLATVTVPARGQIVYTPCNIRMAHSLYGNYGITPLDLNNDGVADFSFQNFAYGTIGRSSEFLAIGARVNGNGIAGVQVEGQRNITAAVLPRGAEVGSSDNFVQGANMALVFGDTQGGYNSGGWLPIESGYLGLKFLINGEVHYGWALVKYPYPYGFLTASIYGYAYESTPNQPIITGKTNGDYQSGTQASITTPTDFKNPSLGLLATGARGLSFWRDVQGSTDTSH